MKTFIVFVNWH